MKYQEHRPENMHPHTWRRLKRAAVCAGYLPPVVIETLSNKFRAMHQDASDGTFLNERHQVEQYSSIFICSLGQPTPYTGSALVHLGIGLIHQGIIMQAPLVHPHRPYCCLIAIDTNHPLPSPAVQSVQRFIDLINTPHDLPYSYAWSTDIPREAWPHLLDKIRHNLRTVAHAAIEAP